MEINYCPDLGGYTTIENIPADIIQKNEILDDEINWIRLYNPQIGLTFDGGEAPSGGMWGPCHLSIGNWLNYEIYVKDEDLHTKLIHQDNMTTLLAYNRELLFYRWMDPRDKVYADKLQNLKTCIDKINPGKDFFHSKFFGALRPLKRYRRLEKHFGHKEISEYYKQYIKILGDLKIDARYNGDVAGKSKKRLIL